MRPKLLLGVVCVVMAAVLGAAFALRPVPEVPATPVVQSPASAPGPAPAQTPAQTSAPAAGRLTMSSVTQHNSAGSCWSAINGNVYDLTSWISRHPGGAQAILSLCGTDGSAAFTTQHGGQRRPADELKGFLLGPLASQ